MVKTRVLKMLCGVIVALFIAKFDFNIVQAQSASIEIPSLEITSDVVSLQIRQTANGGTWDTRRLADQVGHLTGTGWFGQNKNVVLGGHSESIEREPSIFYRLNEIEIGAIIHINANGTTYNYVVTSLEWVVPSDLSSILPTGHDQLTIITCDTESFNDDDGSYEQRLVVRALPA